jgi:hypothetical protein
MALIGMSDTQILTIALAALPTMITVLIGILINNSRLTDLRGHMDARFLESDRRVDAMKDEMNRRFDDMRDTWRAELHRVEEVLDARLQHLEAHFK